MNDTAFLFFDSESFIIIKMSFLNFFERFFYDIQLHNKREDKRSQQANIIP